MKTWAIILCFSALFLSLGKHTNAATMVFPDPHNGGSGTPAVGDDRHGREFETYGMTVERVGNTFTFTLSTDFVGRRGLSLDTDGNTQGDVTWNIYYADLLFDTSMPTLTKNPDGSFDMTGFNPNFGVVFATDDGGAGTGYNGATVVRQTFLTAGFYHISSLLTASDYASSYTSTSPAAYTYPATQYNPDYYVKIDDGASFYYTLSSAPVPVTDFGALPTNDVADKVIQISFTITDQNILDMFTDGFTAFWATGTCGNDGVVAVVPVPPSLLLMGSGLLSMMGFTVARRYRSGGRRSKKA